MLIAFMTLIYVGLALIGLYAALSFCSAMRMWWVHGRYMHVEFVREQFIRGQWAPRRRRLLRKLRGAALTAAFAVIGSAVAAVTTLQSPGRTAVVAQVDSASQLSAK